MSVGTRIREVMKNPPLKFQIQGVRFIDYYGGRVLVGDDCGLGKTYQAIAWKAIHPEVKRVIVVCPATMKYAWENEFRDHAGIQTEVLDGSKAHKPCYEIVILNYDILSYWMEEIKKLKHQLLIVDECHYIKNQDAKRTKLCKELSKVPHMLALSGTPMTNRPVELFPVLQMLRPKEYRSFIRYAFDYCEPTTGYKGRGWDYTGAENLEELHDRLSTVMIRRMKEEVMKDLPSLRNTIIPVDINNRRTYEAAKKDFLGWLRKNFSQEKADKAANAEKLVRFGALQEIVAKGKLKYINKWIKDWLEQSNDKLVIFGIHRPIIRDIWENNPGAMVVDGNTPLKRRQDYIDKFQKDPSKRLLIGNMEALGVGPTLTASSTVLFVELGWNESAHKQCTDRVRRIGQKAKAINAYYIISRNTIEKKILGIINKKKDICDQVLDGKSSETDSMLFDLCEQEKI